MVTIKDIAADAGVSFKTVSRVVNNETGVSAAVKDKVQKSIEKLGYLRNDNARNMRSQRSRLIGFLLPTINSGFFHAIHTSALIACESKGYGLLPYPIATDLCSEKASLDALQHFVKHRRLDGILITAPYVNMTSIHRFLKSNKIPYASIAPIGEFQKGRYIICNNREGMYRLTQHLIDLGHRRIGYVSGAEGVIATVDRKEGFLKALQDNRVTPQENLIYPGSFTPDSGFAAAKQLLSLPKPPTAIVCANDRMAAGALQYAYNAGINVPRDVSITGFDDGAEAELLAPPLTTVRQPTQEMATLAVHSLIDFLENGTRFRKIAPLGCELIVRSSTGAVKS